MDAIGMDDTHDTLAFSETLVYENAGIYLSELQRQILFAALQGTRKTYAQIAQESGYSSQYVRQDVAPKLWHLLSDILGQKVTKANVRFLLEKAMHSVPAVPAVPALSNPLAIARASVEGATTIAPPNLGNSSTTSSIVLVDDEPQNLRILSDLLEEHGYRVRQAISGPIALEAIAEEPPSLVLLDIHMPEMDGYTVCQLLKTNPLTKDVPVIFVSALDETWDKVKAFSVGGADYINKPFRVVEVLARVESQVKLGQLQQALTEQNAQLQQALQKAQQLVAIDEATQVASRRQLDQSLLSTWQQALATPAPITLMLCQIDNFKFEGAAATPQNMTDCLYQVAQAIKAASGEALVCRYSVITFAIVLPQQTLAAGEALAEAILQQVRGLAMTSGPSPLTLSIGLVTARPTPDVALEEALLDPCELRLQQAQGQGGNCWVSADS